jgi:hypothetical protein
MRAVVVSSSESLRSSRVAGPVRADRRVREIPIAIFTASAASPSDGTAANGSSIRVPTNVGLTRCAHIPLNEKCVQGQREPRLQASLCPVDVGLVELDLRLVLENRVIVGTDDIHPNSNGRVITTFRSPRTGNDWTINFSHGS